jgi:Fungal N-terminal domain of STAND proteins
MAEAFGIVSGGLGVVSLSLQIDDCIKRLKDFCNLLKEPPDEVRLVLNEVEVLSLVLQDIEHSVHDQSTCLPTVKAAVMRSLHLCRLSGDALLALSRDLNSNMASGKGWALLKATLKKDRMARFQVKLEGAKRTLMLANQCYYQ